MTLTFTAPPAMTAWHFGGFANVTIDGAVTIDWPLVEEVAASPPTEGGPWPHGYGPGMGRAIALLLLEARRQGGVQ
jgi:hypothetical protein